MAWQSQKLGDVCDLYQPKTISSKDMVANGQYPVFGANGLIGRYDKYNHEEPQLLITCRGATCGTINISEPRSWITGNSMVVKPKVENLDLNFLRYLLIGGVNLNSAITGAAQPQITRQSLSPVQISYSDDIQEQKQIVAILDGAFANINHARQLTERNLKNARELFDSSLNQIFTQSGEGYVEKNLTTFCEKVSTGPFGSLLHKSDYQSDGIPLINPINIVDQKIVPDNEKRVDELKLKELSSYLLKTGDVIIARRGEIGRCAEVLPENDGWLCGTGSFFIRPKSILSGKYLSYLLSSGIYRKKLETASTGATMSNLSNTALATLIIAVPSLEKQFAELDKIENVKIQTRQIEAIYQQKITALDELKQSLLQKAFRGELTQDQAAA